MSTLTMHPQRSKTPAVLMPPPLTSRPITQQAPAEPDHSLESFISQRLNQAGGQSMGRPGSPAGMTFASGPYKGMSFEQAREAAQQEWAGLGDQGRSAWWQTNNPANLRASSPSGVGGTGTGMVTMPKYGPLLGSKPAPLASPSFTAPVGDVNALASARSGITTSPSGAVTTSGGGVIQNSTNAQAGPVMPTQTSKSLVSPFGTGSATFDRTAATPPGQFNMSNTYDPTRKAVNSTVGGVQMPKLAAPAPAPAPAPTQPYSVGTNLMMDPSKPAGSRLDFKTPPAPAAPAPTASVPSATAPLQTSTAPRPWMIGIPRVAPSPTEVTPAPSQKVTPQPTLASPAGLMARGAINTVKEGADAVGNTVGSAMYDVAAPAMNFGVGAADMTKRGISTGIDAAKTVGSAIGSAASKTNSMITTPAMNFGAGAGNLVKNVASDIKGAFTPSIPVDPTTGKPIEARAKGGPVKPGKPYLVGEKGPEIIVPKQAGKVIPNHKIKGGPQMPSRK
jgi:hypothetical protein